MARTKQVSRYTPLSKAPRPKPPSTPEPKMPRYCIVCKDFPRDTMVQSTKCKIRVHSGCTTSIEENEDYLCACCRSRQSGDPEYFVDSIKGHRIEPNGSRKFLVHRIGYKDPDWIPEENMQGCRDLLIQYINNHNAKNHAQLAPTKLLAGPPVVGAEPGETTTSNWVELDDVIFMSAMRTKYRIHPIIWPQQIPLTHTGSYIMAKGQHAAVFAVYRGDSTYVRIADGTNMCLQDTEEENRAMLTSPNEDIDLKVCKYTMYGKNDRCGSAATLIALEFDKRLQLNPTAAGDICVNRKTFQHYQKALHPDESGLHQGKLLNVGNSTCLICNQVFK